MINSFCTKLFIISVALNGCSDHEREELLPRDQHLHSLATGINSLFETEHAILWKSVFPAPFSFNVDFRDSLDKLEVVIHDIATSGFRDISQKYGSFITTARGTPFCARQSRPHRCQQEGNLLSAFMDAGRCEGGGRQHLRSIMSCLQLFVSVFASRNVERKSVKLQNEY